MSGNPIRSIRILILFFIFGLVLSGVTAIPLESELRAFSAIVGADRLGLSEKSGFQKWIEKVKDGVVENNLKYPFMAYGTDWLAFGHFMIALVFVGALRDPVKNVWVIDFGIIACILTIPFALIMGGERGIPFGWRLIDCSFGIFGMIPLLICRRLVQRLVRSENASVLSSTF
jgi:hypothetical protein